MYVVEDKGAAIALMMASLCFLGTWPALLTLLERRGRLPQHTYLDYSLTNLLAAVVIAFTFGQIGTSIPDSPNFLTQLAQDNAPSVAFAMAGGIVLTIGNLTTQYAWAYAGLSVTEVVSCSIAVIVGSTINYFLDNRINRAQILFPGVACFFVAVCLGYAVNYSNKADNKAKLDDAMHNNGQMSDRNRHLIDMEDDGTTIKQTKYGNYFSIPNVERRKTAHSESNAAVKVGSAEYLHRLEKTRAIKVRGSSWYLGMMIVSFSGICFSLFSPAFNLATNDQWHKLPLGVPHLVVYTAFFYFSISSFVLGVVLNIIFLYCPICGVPSSTLAAYASDWEGRHWALLAGLLCGFGNGFQFMGGQAAGYAAADAVQALPLVTTIWAVLLFGEYRQSSQRTYILLATELFMFIIAVGVLMGSSGKREHVS